MVPMEVEVHSPPFSTILFTGLKRDFQAGDLVMIFSPV